jgi:hypothetical protein
MCVRLWSAWRVRTKKEGSLEPFFLLISASLSCWDWEGGCREMISLALMGHLLQHGFEQICDFSLSTHARKGHEIMQIKLLPFDFLSRSAALIRFVALL